MLLMLSFGICNAQITIEEGVGVGPLKLGQSFEEVVSVLGFDGDLKTYDDYLAEELFTEDPEIALECALGFDYYVKYEHLLKLPVSYIFFKDNVITQIKVSSFPAYFFAMARDTKTKTGLEFWSPSNQMVDLYGSPDLKVTYDYLILDSYFYFDKGITLSVREDSYRTAHIYASPDAGLVQKFSAVF